jgi:hypothetical protein
MAAGIYNFICEQGATFNRTFTVKDAAGDPLDLTDFIARMQVRRDIDAAEPMIELTTENGGIELGGEEGTVSLFISAGDTSDIPRSGVYDIEIQSGQNGETSRILKGQFILDPEVTK